MFVKESKQIYLFVPLLQMWTMCTNPPPLPLRSSLRHLPSDDSCDRPRTNQCTRIYWRHQLDRNIYQARFGLNPGRSKRSNGKMMLRYNKNTVRCQYKVINFLTNIKEDIPYLARLWIQHLIDILPESFMQHITILDRVTTALDCKTLRCLWWGWGDAFCHLWKIGMNTVETLYNTINFCWNTHKRHSIARPKGRGMGCLLWVQRATYCVDLSKLSSMKYLL